MATERDAPNSILCTVSEFFGYRENLEVVVPKIQRPYAQGRDSSDALRARFVDSLFQALEEDRDLELNFIYGSESGPDGTGRTRFELLDGQQRLTTLILLYWYLACAEKMPEPPEFMKAFTYETRTTTEAFLKEISTRTMDFAGKKPSESIRDKYWFTLAFDMDSSVRGMLTMLDAIDSRYQRAKDQGQLYGRMKRLKFYKLPLENFDLTEEVYIKMNARGLALTPFESFKADLVKYMEDCPAFQQQSPMQIAGCPLAPYYLNFALKLDNLWTNIFWKGDDASGREYSDRFFRFFYRFLAGKIFLEEQAQEPLDKFRPKSGNTIWEFFWTESPKQEKVYLGFDFYKELLDKHPEYIKTMELILDWFVIVDDTLLEKETCAHWDPEESWKFFEKEKYRLEDAVMFTAVCEYIEKSGDQFNNDNFKRWLHIVRNAIGGQQFNDIGDYISLARNFNKLLSQPQGILNIHAAIANYTPSNMQRNLLESIKKAKIIIDHPGQNWEDAFRNAEAHPFFAGSIDFLLHDLPKTAADFVKRADIVRALFDKDGMTEESKKNHRLLRVLMRQLISGEELLGKRYRLTEKQDPERHLRTFLLEQKRAAKFLCQLADCKAVSVSTLGGLYGFVDLTSDSLIDIAKDAPKLTNNPSLANAWRRLCLDCGLYDFMANAEGKKAFAFAIRDRFFYCIQRPNSWYDRIYIGVERRKSIAMALDLGYTFIDPDDAVFFRKYGDVKNDGRYFNEILYAGKWLQYEVKPGHYLELVVLRDGVVRFCVSKNDGFLSAQFQQPKYFQEKICIAEVDANGKNIVNLEREHRKILKHFQLALPVFPLSVPVVV